MFTDRYKMHTPYNPPPTRWVTVLVARPAASAEAIAESAAKFDADAIVMGTRGNTGLNHIVLGSVAERTLRHAP